MGMDVELEHGTQDHATNVTDDDVTVTAKIASTKIRTLFAPVVPKKE